MNYTKPFCQISKNDFDLAGGKGASLGEMFQAGLPVPDGFVILSSAFDTFLSNNNLDNEIKNTLSNVCLDSSSSLETASVKIKDLILHSQLSEVMDKEIAVAFKNLDCDYVAVRSSATCEDSSSAAWAGQLDSFLNTDKKHLLDSIKQCWASLFTARAIFYRLENRLSEQKISVAVVIQKMVSPEVSGVAFSVHPLTKDYNQLIIEAGFGLGEAVVSGQITPDSYIVSKSPLAILQKDIETKERAIFSNESGHGTSWHDVSPDKANIACLNDEDILDLSRLVIEVENHYDFPCDIEWSKEGDSFYLVQSRPITTL